MKVITPQSVYNWLADAALIGSDRKLRLNAFEIAQRIVIPGDAGRKAALAKFITDLVRSGDQGLLWIDEFGIWPSSENWLIFKAIRLLFNETRPLDEAPGHLFETKDIEVIEALLATILYFSWGAVLVDGLHDIVVRISHDEYAEFYCRSESLRERVKERIRQYIGQ